MYAVLIVLVAFGMLNTLLMSVLERTHEFGILLALGVRHSKLGRMIITESAVLALTGMLLGMLARWAADMVLPRQRRHLSRHGGNERTF